jgi:hypothetical protein
MAYLGTHIWWLEGFEAWRRTKIEVKLNINEKIKRVLGGWAVGSRIQDVVKTASTVSVIVDGQHSSAEVKYRDPSLDIAILWVDGLVIPSVGKLEKWGEITPGDPVYAIGAPKGLPRTITEGIVSAIRAKDGNQYPESVSRLPPHPKTA